MKQTCIGVTRIDGSKGENKYDMARIVVLVPAESREGKNKNTGDPYRVRAFGLDTAELDCTIECFDAMKELKYPNQYELETDTEMRMGRMQTIVTGFTPVIQQSKVA